MKPQPHYQSGDRIGGRYQVHKAIMGGMGEVYLCLDLEENYPYALKTFQQRYLSDNQRLRSAFEREVAIWVALEKHPNIVRCFWMQVFDSQPFMALEWIANEEDRSADLRGWLRRGPLDLKLAIQIAIDLCHGLIHAQDKRPGLVHRDLKPENILIAQGGLVKITDFGLAQVVAAAGLVVEGMADGRQSLVGKRGIAGTPAYMAPEQWRDELLDVRTDIYALGCIMYEMLAGRPPFQVDIHPITPQSYRQWLSAIQAKHEHSQPSALPADVPLAGRALVERCLSKALVARPNSIEEVLTHLKDLYRVVFQVLPPTSSSANEFSAIDYNNRGSTYYALRQYDVALVDFNHAQQLDPTLAQVPYNRGNTHVELQQYELALADFTSALQLDPNLVTAYTNRGNMYSDLQQYEEALADYNRALDLDPTYAKAYNNRGLTYADLQQHEAAVSDYNRALALDPTYVKAYNNRGLSYHSLKQYEAALTDYNRALALDPTYARAYNNRGLTYHSLKQNKAALSDFSCALNLDHTYAKAYVSRGATYAALQEHEAALADYKRALDLNPSLAQANVNIGVLFVNQGKPAEALPYFEKAAQLGHPQGAPYAAKVRRILEMKPAASDDAAQQAFVAFAQADSLVMMHEVVAHFPSLLEADFMAAIENVIAQQIPSEYRQTFLQRLGWLRQIANTQGQRSSQ